MVTFKVKNMRCEHCSARIEDALKKENIEAEVRLADKTVTVADDKREAVSGLLDDLGFEAETV